MSVISNIVARQVLDSRGNPTVEADVFTDSGHMGRARVPSGASKGSKEALELRDEDPTFFGGKGVTQAVNNIKNQIAGALKGSSVTNQELIDSTMLQLDGTEFKTKLGANAMLAVSMAACRAGAESVNLPLYRYLMEHLSIPRSGDDRLALMPAPLMNIINGGAHAANDLDIQEFMIVPHMRKSFGENLRAGVEIFHALKKRLQAKNLSTNVGDEGGFAPNLSKNKDALDAIMGAIEDAGYRPGQDVSLALDSAATEFYHDKSYKMEGRDFGPYEMVTYYKDLIANYPIYSIEDGLAESDGDSWTLMTKEIGQKVLTIGDDLFVTNKKILSEGIEHKRANAILIKVNQIGTLSETFATLELAYRYGIKAVISHRSGETSDHFIADLAVACGAGHIKTGSASRSDRTEKYNQLLRIEEELGTGCTYNAVR